MSTQSYYTIRQRNPLRVPSSFNEQERSLVIQLEGIFDDIYKKFGRLGMDDMSGEFKFVINNKYDKISGITITDEGVNITGSKYVKISADDGGEWEYNADGLHYYKEGDPLPFQIARYADKKSLTNGLFYDYSTTGETGEVILLAMCQNDEHTSTSGYWDGEIAYAMTDTTGDLDTDVPMGLFYPKKGKGALGTSQKPWRFLFCRNYMGEYDSGVSKGIITFNPDPAYAKRSIAIQFQTEEYTENGQTKDRFRIISTNSVDTFSLIGNATDHNMIINFETISGVRYLSGDDSTGYICIRPNSSAGKETVRLIVKELVSSNDQLVQVYGDAGVDRVVYYGNLVGNVTGNVTGNLTGTVNLKTTTETSFNNITDPGRYAFSSLSSMSDRPSNIISGVGTLEVVYTSYHIWQMLTFEESIYIRNYSSGTWGSWYRMRGFSGAPTYGQLSGRT